MVNILIMLVFKNCHNTYGEKNLSLVEIKKGLQMSVSRKLLKLQLRDND